MNNATHYAGSQDRASGRVVFLGARCADPDPEGVMSRRELQQADVIVYDRAMTPTLLEGSRLDAIKVAVPGTLYDGATDILIREAKAGKRVVRMSCAEPSLEETVSVAAEGLAFETAPGLSAPRLTEATAFPVNDEFRDFILRGAS